MTDTTVAIPGPDVVPEDPFEAAKELVVLEREKKTLDRQLDTTKERIAARKALVLQAMENEAFSTSQNVLGANVHLHTQVWAGPADGDHAALSAVLSELGYVELLPSTVNAQRFSAFVREQIRETDKTLPLDERIALGLPKLAAVTKATEKREVRVTGA